MMKILKLMTFSVIFWALSQLAYAGGMEAPHAYGRFYVGLGGAINFVQIEQELLAPFQSTLAGTPPLGTRAEQNTFGLSPVGQIGYDWYFSSGGFVGLKGLYNYIDKQSSLFFGNISSSHFTHRSMLAAMLVGGFRHGDNAFYAEAGYAALFSKQELFNISGVVLEGSLTKTLSGGIAGVGFRHYFWQRLFVDAVYSYALFSDGSALIANDRARPGLNSRQLAKRPRVQDITLTVNYMF